MLDAGVLEEGPGLELLEGDLVVMSPQGASHAGFVELVRNRLLELAGPGYTTRAHAPVDAGPHSEPEPDVVLLRGRVEDFLGRHPNAEDTVLVVEVARSSLPRDRDKARIYAAAGFAEHWLFDLDSRSVELHRNPVGGTYQHRQIATQRERLQVPTCEAELDLASLFLLLPS